MVLLLPLPLRGTGCNTTKVQTIVPVYSLQLSVISLEYVFSWFYSRIPLPLNESIRCPNIGKTCFRITYAKMIFLLFVRLNNMLQPKRRIKAKTRFVQVIQIIFDFDLQNYAKTNLHKTNIAFVFTFNFCHSVNGKKKNNTYMEREGESEIHTQQFENCYFLFSGV